ncbi:VOC domain-containing protein [Novosphingobium lubricantis]|jgi:catechol 2,3-dioxygenase-like lactoylglutathione lyase family enzyme
MSIIKAVDVAYVRFAAPDLASQLKFLHDFGFVTAGEVDTTTYLRGHGNAPFCYAVEQGEPAFLSFGIWAKSLAELEAIAAHDGTIVEKLDSPGGGYRTILTDPDGFKVEVVAGQQMAQAEPLAPPAPWNEGSDHPRIASFRRIPVAPARILRLGHVVFGVSDFRTTESWYKERFGLVTSDEIQPAPGVSIGAFMRCDRGDTPCDHHTLFLLQRPQVPPGFMHAAFEVASVDDLMVGHDYLADAGHTPFWGVGRHVLGSQVFDYWLDPNGFELEHWTDGDQLKASDGGGIASLAELLSVQWGMKMPPLPEPI